VSRLQWFRRNELYHACWASDHFELMRPLNTSSRPIIDCSSVALLIRCSILSFVVGGKCSGGRLVVQLVIPFIMAKVIRGAVLLRRSQLHIYVKI